MGFLSDPLAEFAYSAAPGWAFSFVLKKVADDLVEEFKTCLPLTPNYRNRSAIGLWIKNGKAIYWRLRCKHLATK